MNTARLFEFLILSEHTEGNFLAGVRMLRSRYPPREKNTSTNSRISVIKLSLLHTNPPLTYRPEITHIHRTFTPPQSLASTHPPSPQSSQPTRIPLPPRKPLILTLINPHQQRTPQPLQTPLNTLHQRLQGLRQILINSRQHRRRLRLYQLKNETLQIIALGQRSGIEDAFSESRDVNAGEGVRGAGVAADGEKAGVLAWELEDVEDEAVIIGFSLSMLYCEQRYAKA